LSIFFQTYMKQVAESEGEKLLAPKDREKKSSKHWSFEVHDNPEVLAVCVCVCVCVWRWAFVCEKEK